MDASRLVFIDETGAKTNMTRRYGRAADGQRALGNAPHGHWKTTTVIGSLRLDGSTSCMTLDGATDRAAFDTYVREVLAPTLHPGDVVIWDNLSAHHSADALSAIHAVSAKTLPLPPYSPDLNPIEQMWSKIKTLLRGAQARTREELEDAIATALRAVTPEDARAWIRECGYTAFQC